MALHRLFRKEEAVADLTIDHDLRVALSPSRGHSVETTRVVDITGQDLFSLCSIHDNPRIGAVCCLL